MRSFMLSSFRYRNLRYISSFFLCALLWFYIPAGYATTDTLPSSVTALLKKYQVPRSSISIYIQAVDKNTPLLSINADTPRNPASTMKLLVTYAGLELLGREYTWETQFFIDGSLKNGVLYGNLIVRGSGDPLLSRELLLQALYILRQRGIRDITGDLLLDDKMFLRTAGHPGDFDRQPYRPYNAFPSALLLNYNVQSFHLIPRSGKLHVYMDPPAANLNLINRVQLQSGSCNSNSRNVNFTVNTDPEITTVTLSGKYPATCGELQLYRSVMSNERLFFGVFKSFWESLGGSIGGSYKNTIADTSKPAFHQIRSLPLRHIIPHINKYSNNVMARQVFLTLGTQQHNKFISNYDSEKVVKTWLQKIGISAPQLKIENGSGLSRTSRISARTFARILQHAWHGEYQAEFLASLSVNGIDGTMKKRLNGKLPSGVVRAKTGLLRDVRTLAAYLQNARKQQYIVVILHNYRNIQLQTGTKIQDALLTWLYRQ